MNLAALTCWGYYQILDIGVSIRCQFTVQGMLYISDCLPEQHMDELILGDVVSYCVESGFLYG